MSEIKIRSNNPIFFINEEMRNEEFIYDWAYKVLRMGKWIKFKQLEINKFELKEHFPCPPDHVCFEKIDEEIEKMSNDCLGLQHVYYEIENILYSESEIRREMLFALREGFFNMCWGGTYLDDINDRCVVKNINFSEDTEFDRVIALGYIVVESK